MVVRGRMHGRRASREGVCVGGVGISHIEVRGHGALRILFVGVAELDRRISDRNFGVHDGAVSARDANTFGAAEGSNEEVDELGRAVD